MTRITLAHGNGGHYMRRLIDEVFAARLANPVLDINTDAATLPPMDGEWLMTVDGFTVQPLEFPGGNIGSLAVHGTINDLAVSGARAKYLSLSAILEEGLELEKLQVIVQSMARAAQDAGVHIVCGDTKVVPRGEGSGIYLTTTGIGVKNGPMKLGIKQISDGDCLLVSGSMGDHGTAVMLAREQFGLRGNIQSDSASVVPLCEALYDLPGLRFMRDPTRGGLATVLHEIHRATALGVRVHQTRIPVKEPVSSICEILGYDPMYLACEGRVVAAVAEDSAQQALERWRQLPQGGDAQIIGNVTGELSQVIMVTEIGGERLVEELQDDPLPRIC